MTRNTPKSAMKEVVIRPVMGINLQSQLAEVIGKGVRRVFLDGTFTSGRKRQFSLLTISQNIEIVGTPETVMDGQNIATHLLFISDKVKVKFTGVRFTKGNTQNIHLQQFSENSPKSRQNIFRYLDGGAISMGIGSEVVLVNCSFESNHSGICGGAISNLGGYLHVRNCLFQDNTCGDTGAAIDNLASGCLTVVESCTFINNKANKLGKGNFGAVTAFPNTYLVIKNSNFSKETETAVDYRPNKKGVSYVFIDNKSIFNKKILQPVVTKPKPNSGVRKAITSRLIKILLQGGRVAFEDIPCVSHEVNEKHLALFNQRTKNLRKIACI